MKPGMSSGFTRQSPVRSPLRIVLNDAYSPASTLPLLLIEAGTWLAYTSAEPSAVG